MYVIINLSEKITSHGHDLNPTRPTMPGHVTCIQCQRLILLSARSLVDPPTKADVAPALSIAEALRAVIFQLLNP